MLRALIGAAAVALYAVASAPIETFSIAAYITIAVPAAVATAVAVRRGWHRKEAPAGAMAREDTAACGLDRRWPYAVWFVLAAGAVIFQLMCWTSNPRSTYPTLSSLVNIAFDSFPVRVIGRAAWLLLAAWIIGR